MNIEIVETRLNKKKNVLKMIASDYKAIRKASYILHELGMDNSQLEEVAKTIKNDMEHCAEEAAMLNNAFIKAKKEFYKDESEKN
jgi:hypothetical protein